MTYERLENYLDEDLGWRKQEISELLTLTKGNEKEVLCKSLILLIYSHWEGYIKKCSKFYIKYVAEKAVKIDDLSNNFTAMMLKSRVSNCFDTSDNLTMQNEIIFVNKFYDRLGSNFDLGINPFDDKGSNIIDTKSNLKPKVLRSIMTILGIEYKSAIETREIYINSNLLGLRNSIGHGSKYNPHISDDFNLNVIDIEKMKNIVFTILNNFRDEILEYAASEYYLTANNEDRLNYSVAHAQSLESELSALED